jgi:S-adenosylmethionine hydrolase
MPKLCSVCHHTFGSNNCYVDEKFGSLRTTIPMSIVRQWKLKEGDELDWEWKVIEGKMMLVVSKI